jgi:hypothetical protein
VNVGAPAAFEGVPSTSAVTGTVPAGSGGVVAVHDVEVGQETDAVPVPLPEPNQKRVWPGVVENPVPEMVTDVPPLVVPEDGWIEVTVGGGGGGT